MEEIEEFARQESWFRILGLAQREDTSHDTVFGAYCGFSTRRTFKRRFHLGTVSRVKVVGDRLVSSAGARTPEEERRLRWSEPGPPSSAGARQLKTEEKSN